MKINIIKSISGTLLALALVVPTFVFAQTVPTAVGQNTGAATQGSSSGSSAPQAVGQGIGAATQGSTSGSSVPHAVGQNTGAATGSVTVPPVATGQGIGAATHGSTVTGSTVIVSPATVGSTGGGSGNGTGVSTPGNIGTLPALINTNQCQYLTNYLKLGGKNSIADVTKLQNFLKTENIDVNVTGVFDQKTFQAVEAFQAKYVVDVMRPWGVASPTGQVYYTTTKKINELYCKKTFSLTSAQLAEIEAYRTSIKNQTPAPNSAVPVPKEVPQEVGSNETPVGTPTGSIDTGANDTDMNGTSTFSETQVGAAAKTSVFSNVWNFVKRIFGR